MLFLNTNLEFTLSVQFGTPKYKEHLQFICSGYERSKPEYTYIFGSLFASLVSRVIQTEVKKPW